MFTVITDFGAACLDKARLQDKRIEFTRFELGLLTSPIPDVTPETFDVTAYMALRDPVWFQANYTAHWEGGQSDISYLPLSSEKVNIRCYVPAGLEKFRFNTTVLIARCDGQEGIFLFSHYLVDNPRFNLEISEGGMRYWFQLNISLTDVLNRFIWSNLTRKMVSFLEVDSVFDLEDAIRDRRDQALLAEHWLMPRFKGKHVLINTMGQWYGTPAVPLTMNNQPSPLVIQRQGEVYSRRDGYLPAGWKWMLDEQGHRILDYAGHPRIERI